MHAGAGVPPTDIAALIATHLPGFRVGSVSLLGEGEDNLSYEAGHGLIVRFSKEPDPDVRSESINRETRLLTTVARISPVGIPDPVFTAAEHGCLAYYKLAGQPLIDMPAALRTIHAGPVASTLGELLAALHSIAHDRVADLVTEDAQPIQLWLAEAVGNYRAVSEQIPAEYRAAIETFFAARPPDDCTSLVFSHNDLGIEHILFDPQDARISGVIDWSDAALTDPAYDFALLYRDLGPTALDRALSTYSTLVTADPAIRERARFYARCSVFEDIVYGLETEHVKYVHKSLAALPWLFPAHDQS